MLSRSLRAAARYLPRSRGFLSGCARLKFGRRTARQFSTASNVDNLLRQLEAEIEYEQKEYSPVKNK